MEAEVVELPEDPIILQSQLEFEDLSRHGRRILP